MLELVLVFGFDRGIAGSAWGTVVAQMASAAAMLVIVVPRLRRDGLHRLVVVPRVMWEVVKVGAHLVQRTAFLLAALAVATATASKVGTAELAGHQIAAQLFLFLAIGVDMFKVAGQSLVGHALGSGDRARRSDIVVHLRRWAWRAGIVLTVVVLVLTPGAAAAVQQRPRRHPTRPRIALLVLAAMQVPAAITFVFDGVLMGANDFRDLRWQTTLAFLAALPVFGAGVPATRRSGSPACGRRCSCGSAVRAARNHHRVRGAEWMAGAERV